MLKLDNLLYEVLPSKYIDNSPQGVLNNSIRENIKLKSFILSYFNNYEKTKVTVGLITNNLIDTETKILYIENDLLFFNTKEINECNKPEYIINADFDSRQLGLEDIPVGRILSLKIEDLTWYKI